MRFRRERREITEMFRTIRAETADLIAEKARTAGGQYADPRFHDMITAQNVLRIALETVLVECLPYDRMFLMELAQRAASYVISAGPVEDHKEMAKAVAATLPDAVTARVSQGTEPRATWMSDGVQHRNVPSKDDLQ